MRDMAYGFGFSEHELSSFATELAANGFQLSSMAQIEDAIACPALVLIKIGQGDFQTRPVFAGFAVAVIEEADFASCSEALRAGFTDVLPLNAAPEEVRQCLTRFSNWMEEGRAPDNLRPLAEIEKRAIKHALLVCRGQMSMVARRLGIGRSTLYRKVELYKIRVDG